MTETRTSVLDPKVAEVLRNIQHRVGQIIAYYGPKSDEAVEAQTSALNAIVQTLTASEVWASEGPLGLGGKMGSIIFGMIAHPSRNMCTAGDDCLAYLSEEGEVRYYRRPTTEDHVHAWSRPVGSPDPVSWSLHS